MPTSRRCQTHAWVDLGDPDTQVPLFGQIQFERPGVGRHRRVRLTDVIAYQERKRAERRQALDALTRGAVDAGLYQAPVDYSQALQAARRRQG